MRAAALSPGDVYVSKRGPCTDANPCNNIHACVIPELKLSDLHFKIQVILKG
jgi:hypothetical protein